MIRKRPLVAKNAISLFSGAGGDTLGLKRAGYNVIAFSEFKKPAIATHLKEFPNSTLISPESITNIPDEVFETYTGIDIIFAGFPCQGFSNAGKKKADDPRNELVHEFVRVTLIIKPRYIIGENVSGLLSRTGHDPVTNSERPVIDIIRDLFANIGYNIEYKVLHATDFGVPQERKRLIIVGSKGVPNMNWNVTSDVKPGIRHFLETHLDGAMEFKKQDVSAHYWIHTDLTEVTGKPHPNLVRLVNGIRNKSKDEDGDGDGDKHITVEGGLISFGVRKSSYHGQILDPDLPCKTIICTYATCPRLFVGLYNSSIDTYWIRCLSIRELGQIQGFPADYQWQGNEKEIITQIGNAVPPPLCEAVVRRLTGNS
jgi:DNA (cytosine-5)-methyltransferase 1